MIPIAKSKRPPAQSPKEQEDRCIALAMSLAEQKLRDGTASNSLIIHYLDLATEREELKREALRQDIELTKTKNEAIKSQEKAEEMYEEAIKHLKSYQGNNFQNGG